MNIPDLVQEIKGVPWGDAAMPLLVILVGVGSFGLGRMSALEVAKPPIIVSQLAVAASSQGGDPSSATPTKAGQVVASKTGSKYHFPWCAGASQISEKNKVWFDTPEAARTAGYSPAGNCKGLK